MNKLVDAQNEPIKQYLAGSDEKKSIKKAELKKAIKKKKDFLNHNINK